MRPSTARSSISPRSSGVTKAITTRALRKKSCPPSRPRNSRHALDPGGAHRPRHTRSDALRQSLFDPDFEPLITAKSPSGGKDIVQASANNFYLGVSLADLKGFNERYRLNSRVARENGKLVEQVYRAGTPDGRVPPGLYADTCARPTTASRRPGPTPNRNSQSLDDLIRYYQTGEFKDWIQFDIDWVQDDEPVDFANGFIEIYRDARGAKGASQGFVSITDQKLSATILKIAANAQYFEDKRPGIRTTRSRA